MRMAMTFEAEALNLASSLNLSASWESDVLYLTLPPKRAGFVASILAEQGLMSSYVDQVLQIQATSNLVTALQRALCPDLLCLDIDGCLIDTRASFDGVVKQLVLELTGSPTNDQEMEMIRREGGFNDDNVLVYEIARRRGCEIALDSIFPRFSEVYFGTETQPGLYLREKAIMRPELLQAWRSRFPVALVTGRNRQEGQLAMNLLGIGDISMWTIDDVQQGKPDPEGILKASAQFNARHVWMVGDNVDDILAAQCAGAVGIGVGRYREALHAVKATTVLDNINELEELL